jgi:cytochrome c553
MLMRIKVYLDNGAAPIAELASATQRFEIDTTKLPDGVHKLRMEAIEDGRVTGVREIPFNVRNGPGISVAGLTDGDEVAGKLRVSATASAAGINHRLDVHALELHRGLPFWIGAFAVGIVLAVAAYLVTDPLRYRQYITAQRSLEPSNAAVPTGPRSAAPSAPPPTPMHVTLEKNTFLPALPFDASKGNAARGAALFAARCADCHGPAGQGRSGETISQGRAGIYPRLAGQQPGYIYRQLFSFTHGWRQSPQMQRMASGLADQDMMDLAVYIGSLQTPYAVAAPPADDTLQLGAAIATKGLTDKGVSRCDGCHGPNGAGVSPHFPTLMGQNAAYMAAQIAAFRAGTRRNSLLRLMEPVAHGLSAAEVDAVTRYYQSLRPSGSG